MMELYDIIEAASRYIHPTNGTLVLHRSMKEHPKFKVYKKYCYYIYLVKNGKKEQLLSWECTKNSPSDSILSDWKELDKEFLLQLVPWLSSESYIKLKDGI